MSDIVNVYMRLATPEYQKRAWELVTLLETVPRKLQFVIRKYGLICI